MLAVLAAGVFWSVGWPFTVDDAFIAARYAVRLAQGAGYTFVDGPATDGVTGPLWLLPLTLTVLLGGDPIVAAKLLGALCSVVASHAVIVRVASRARGGEGAWFSAALLGSALPFLAWATAGLESALAGLCATWLALAVTARPTPRPRAAGLAFAAIAWLRPELVPFGAVLLGLLGLRARTALARALVPALLGVAALVVFRLWMFGDVLPLSAHAKPPLAGHGFAYLMAVLARPRALLIAGLLALSLRRGGRDAWWLTGALSVHGLALVLSGGDWMPGFRLIAPVVPTLALTLGFAVPRAALRARFRTLLLVSLALAFGLAELAVTLPTLREAGLRRAARLSPLVHAVCTAPGPVVLVDVGALGLACVDQALIDLGGLTDPHIAHARGGHLSKQVDGAWLRAQRPALIVLHSRERPRVDAAGHLRWFAGYPVERRLLGLAWVRADFAATEIHEYAPDYFYVLLRRRE